MHFITLQVQILKFISLSPQAVLPSQAASLGTDYTDYNSLEPKTAGSRTFQVWRYLARVVFLCLLWHPSPFSSLKESGWVYQHLSNWLLCLPAMETVVRRKSERPKGLEIPTAGVPGVWTQLKSLLSGKGSGPGAAPQDEWCRGWHSLGTPGGRYFGHHAQAVLGTKTRKKRRVGRGDITLQSLQRET